jgi:predicted nucleotidyltransferase
MKIEIENLIEKFLEEIKKSQLFSKIEFIVLFGSYLSDYHLDDSDVDICLYIKDNEKNLSKIRLNLLKEFLDKLDLQIYQLLPTYIQVEVLKGKFLYIRNEDRVYEIAYDTIEEYEDFLPLYLDYINRCTS